MIGALKAGQRRDFATAALYMQQDPRHPVDLIRIARELSALRTYYKGNVNLLSTNPEGEVEAGLPPGEVHAGVITVGDTAVDFTLVRVNDPVAGKIWLVSKETVAQIPEMYAALQSQNPTGLDARCSPRHKWATIAGNVAPAVGRVADLNPTVMGAGGIVEFSVESSQARVVKAEKTSCFNHLANTSWVAAQVHPGNPDPRGFCLCDGAAAFVSHLLLSFHRSPAGGLLGVVGEQDDRSRFGEAVAYSRSTKAAENRF